MTASDIFAAYDAALITKGERDEFLTALGTYLTITIIVVNAIKSRNP